MGSVHTINTPEVAEIWRTPDSNDIVKIVVSVPIKGGTHGAIQPGDGMPVMVFVVPQ